MGRESELRATGGAALRRGLPSELPDELLRVRLVTRLAERWNHAVTVVEGPGGYGKSTALAQAVRDNLGDPSGVDVYLSCRSSDSQPLVLARGLAGALRPDADVEPTKALPSLAEAVLHHLAAHAPIDVCLLLDDVHILVGAADSTALLAAVIRDLPSNAHLVLCGRSIPDVPLARLRSQDQVETIGAGELAFRPTETNTLALRHGVTDRDLDDLAGWPAMTRLALSASPAVTFDYLLEEVMADLSPKLQIALATTVIGRRVDDEVLKAVAPSGVGRDELIQGMPLIIELEGGYVAAHDLWHDVIDVVLPEQERAEIADTVARSHLDAGRIDECLEIVTGQHNWEAGKVAVMKALAANDAVLAVGTVERWLGLFPPTERQEPELRLLQGVAARMAGGPAGGEHDVRFALACFQERGQTDYLVAAVLEMGMRAGLSGDMDLIVELGQQIVDLAQAGNPDMQALLTLGQGMMAGSNGNLQADYDANMSVDLDRQLRAMAPILWRARSAMALALGRGAEAIAATDALRGLIPDWLADVERAIVSWQAGDPTHYLALPADWKTIGRDSTRDDFLGFVFSALADACFGINNGWSADLKAPHDTVHDRTQLLLTRCAELVVEGDEATARAEMTDHVAQTSGHHASVSMIRRFPAYGYLLNDELRAAIDEGDLGPLFEQNREVARALYAARHSNRLTLSTLPPVPMIVCALPLPWSVELAAHAAAAKNDALAIELIEYLLAVTGSRAYRQLRRLRADTDVPAATGAEKLLGRFPSPPDDVLHIVVCGGTAVGHGNGQPEAIGRRRVSELLELLLLVGRVDRGRLAGWLWPDSEPKSANNNLRVTLSRLRQLLEPGREANELGFHLRQKGDELWLHHSELIDADTWAIESELTEGRKREARPDPQGAARAYHRAAQLLIDRPFPSLRGVVGLESRLEAWDRAAFTAMAKAAQWSLANHRSAEAERLAERLLAFDPYSEASLQVLIASSLLDDDLDGAGRYVERCRQMLDELDVAPGLHTQTLFRRYQRRVRIST